MDVVTYYTTGDNGFYEAQAAGWLENMRSLGLNANAIRLDSTGDWLANTRRKALVIAAARRGEPLLWVDVDDRLTRVPEVDPAWDVAGLPSPLDDRQIAAPLLYFGRGSRAGAVLDAWVQVCRLEGDRSDEWCLNCALARMVAMRSHLELEPLVVAEFPQGVLASNKSKDRGRHWPSSKEVRHGAPIR